jgi:hypothetical protein
MPAAAADEASLRGEYAQCVLRLPVVVTLMAKLQSSMAPTSMNWPSQKRPPFGVPQVVVQLACCVETQLTSHMMFAWTVHEPSQQSWHTVVQSVEPGCSWHFSVHFVSQLDEHSDEQPSPVHPAMHPDSQSEEQ